MAEPNQPTSTDLAQERTDMAVERTVLAHERTLIAWVRTAASLISFGFTIYKGFDFLAKAGVTRPVGWMTPREFGTSMIGTGLVVLFLAIVQHARSREALKRRGHEMPRSLAMITAAIVAALGFLSLGLGVFGR
jgi:putative membrane protein